MIIYGKHLGVSKEVFRPEKPNPEKTGVGEVLLKNLVTQPAISNTSLVKPLMQHLPPQACAGSVEDVLATIDQILDPLDHHLNSLDLLSDSQIAVKCLEEAIENNYAVGLLYDDDTDGITSEAIMKTAIRSRSSNVPIFSYDMQIKKFGRGFSQDRIDQMINNGVKLFIFLDNGTNNNQEIEYIRAQKVKFKGKKSTGVKVIVIDHHDFEDDTTYNSANAFVSPNQSPVFRNYSTSHLAARIANEIVSESAQDQVKEKIKIFCMLGILCDQRELTPDNKKAVKQGIIAFNKSQAKFVKVLKRVLNLQKITSEDVVMKIGPLFNTARKFDLAGAKLATEILHAKSSNVAWRKVNQLQCLNIIRKTRDLANRNQVRSNSERPIQIHSDSDPVLIYAHPNILRAGVDASRIAETTNKVAFVFKEIRNEQGVVISYSGSGRSPKRDFIDLRLLLKDSVIQECLLKDKEGRILAGGHKPAIGLSILPDKLIKFYDRSNQILKEQIQGRDLRREITPDLEVPLMLLKKQGKAIYQYLQEKVEPVGNSSPEFSFLIRGLTVGEINEASDRYPDMWRFMLTQRESGVDSMLGLLFSPQGRTLKFGDKVDIIASLRPEDTQAKKHPEKQRACLLIHDLRPEIV